MRVYGLDFTSCPTKSKNLTLAECTFEQNVLSIDNLRLLDSKTKGDFTTFEDWLNGTGIWANENDWIAGLDFPFGMPIEAIEHFRWISPDSIKQSWEDCIETLFLTSTSKEFRKLIEGWRNPTRKNSKGEPLRIRKQRLTDKLANSGSPMNYFPPPVCPMFFQGVQRLKNCPKDVSILPVRSVAQAQKTIVEAYPRLVANVFIGRQASYKDKSKKKHDDKVKRKELRQIDESEKQNNRSRIINGLNSEEMQIHYGFRVAISSELTEKCLIDNDGDVLDSVLCAVQATWASRALYNGMPQFSLRILQNLIALEGWIADPIVLQRFENGYS